MAGVGKEGPNRTWVPVFLTALGQTGNISEACRQAGIRRKEAYDWRDENEEFAEAWHERLEQGIDAIEQVARTRALDGNDKLIMFMLRAHRPSVYQNTGPVAEEVTRALSDILTRFADTPEGL